MEQNKDGTWSFSHASIADSILAGMECHINRETGEVVLYPVGIEDQGEDMMEFWQEQFDVIEKDKKNFERIEAPESSDVFKVMEDFADEIAPEEFQSELERILGGMKPIATFNQIVHEVTDLRRPWFDYRRARYTKWVERQLRMSGIDTEKRPLFSKEPL